MSHKTTHLSNLIALRRIEGQVRGIQKMIEDKKYCLDIVNQIHASINGLHRVAEKVITKHMENCVVDSLQGGSMSEKKKKINEIITLARRLHKIC